MEASEVEHAATRLPVVARGHAILFLGASGAHEDARSKHAPLPGTDSSMVAEFEVLSGRKRAIYYPPPLVGSTTLYTPLTLRLYNWQLPEAAVFRPMLTHTSLAGLSS